jgi:hypothetical protein
MPMERAFPKTARRQSTGLPKPQEKLLQVYLMVLFPMVTQTGIAVAESSGAHS